MFAYEFDKKIYCPDCYKDTVPEDERRAGHQLDGNDFCHRFGEAVECSKCQRLLEYHNQITTTDHSLGEYEEE